MDTLYLGESVGLQLRVCGRPVTAMLAVQPRRSSRPSGTTISVINHILSAFPVLSGQLAAWQLGRASRMCSNRVVWSVSQRGRRSRRP